MSKIDIAGEFEWEENRPPRRPTAIKFFSHPTIKKILNKNNCPEYLPRIGLSLSHTFLTRNEVAEFLVTYYCVANWDVAQDMERN